jgi:glycerophosphoryl diester phosphodiesterase
MKQRTHLIIAVLALLVSVQSFSAVKNIAHRGGALLAPENTLAAFRNAVALRADYLELDIVLSSDDSMMVIHDATVDRTTNGSGAVRAMTYAQLRTLDAGIKFHPRFAGERIPTFAEVLAVARSSAYNIRLVPELKSDESHLASLVVTMVQNAGMKSRVILSSFRLSQLLAVKNLDSTIQVQLFATASPVTIDNLRLIRGEWIGSDVTNSGNVTYAH